MPRPNDVFKTIRADEVAECWDGVGDDLYRKLWNVIVPLQPKIPNLEDSGPGDHVGHANLAQFWGMLTRDEQDHLNKLAKEQLAAFRRGEW